MMKLSFNKKPLLNHLLKGLKMILCEEISNFNIVVGGRMLLMYLWSRKLSQDLNLEPIVGRIFTGEDTLPLVYAR